MRVAPKVLVHCGRKFLVLSTLYDYEKSVSAVYHVIADASHEQSAIKQCKDTDRERFMKEVRILKLLHNGHGSSGNPRVVRLRDVEVSPRLQLRFDLATCDFKTTLRSTTTRSESEVRFMFERVLLCIKACHDRRVLHLDVKPANFLWFGPELRIADFGTAAELPAGCDYVESEFEVRLACLLACANVGLTDWHAQLHEP